MWLAEAHAVQSFDDDAHPLEGPQLGPKAMLRRALQDGGAHGRQLPLIELGRSAPPGHGTQSVDAAFIEQRLPRVHGLASHADRQRDLGAALAFLQHSSGTHPLLCCLAQSLLHHAHILQQCSWSYDSHAAI